MRTPPAISEQRLGVFTLDEARADGWSSDALRYAVHKGSLIRLRPGVFGVPGARAPDGFEAARHRLAVAAVSAVLANPAAVASHCVAAVLHDLPLWRLPELPCLTVDPGFVGDIEAAHLHRAKLTAARLTTVRGTATTSVERTIIDIGREHGKLSALVVADAAAHRDLTDVAALRAAAAECAGWPGVRAARAAIELVDERSESPLETVSRFRLDGEVPTPDLQPGIYDALGRFIGRVDFLWDEFGVVGEADGTQKYDGSRPLSLYEEKIRQEKLEAAGLIVVRWGSADLANLDELIRRLQAAFAIGSQPGRARRWTSRPMPRWAA